MPDTVLTPSVNIDPWLDEGQQLGGGGEFFEELPDVAEEEGFVVPEPAQPEVTTFEDGSSLTVEKTKKGWKATLDSNTGAQPEVFYGDTQKAMYAEVARGKVNATRKIRELNKSVKLGNAEPVVPRVTTSKSTLRELTADEIVEYKVLMDSNPQKAMDYFNEKRYGLKPEEFAKKLNEGTVARQLGDIESTGKAFVANNPDYYPVRENFIKVVQYLVKKYFGRAISPNEDFDALTLDLLDAGAWSVESLEAAKEDLLDSELLILPPKTVRVETTPPPAHEPPVVPVSVVPPAPVTPVAEPPVTEPRGITPVTTVRRTRAGNLGIRMAEVSGPNSVVSETPHSDEDPANWSDEAVEAALTKLRLDRQKQR
jgi:hypothetical protein